MFFDSPSSTFSLQKKQLLRRIGPEEVPGRVRVGRSFGCAIALASSLERDVVVGCGRAEVGVARGRGARRHVLVAAGSAAALELLPPAEELDALGDDLDRGALRPVLRVPLAPVEPAVDRDRAALREEMRAALG